MPSILLGGDAAPAAPGGYLMGGVFGSDVNGSSNPWAGRNDVNVQLLWRAAQPGPWKPGVGPRAPGVEQEQALIELFRIQDRVAAEVAQAHAQLESAATRIGKAEVGLKEAQVNFAGNLKGMSETTRFGDILTLVNRPQEVVSALQQLSKAYDNYFLSVNDYNRSQFQLYRALRLSKFRSWVCGSVRPARFSRSTRRDHRRWRRSVPVGTSANYSLPLGGIARHSRTSASTSMLSTLLRTMSVRSSATLRST